MEIYTQEKCLSKKSPMNNYHLDISFKNWHFDKVLGWLL